MKYPKNYRQVTVREDVVTEKVFAGWGRNFEGATLEKGKVYLVENNTGFGCDVYDLNVRGFLASNLFVKYETDFMVSSKDVIFLDGKGGN